MTPLPISTLFTPLNREFPWVRYWRVSEASISSRAPDNSPQEAEDHFLFLPSNKTAEMGLTEHFNLRTLPDLLKSPALVLLGRPGSGKTTELKQVYDKGLFSEDASSVLYRRASSFASQDARAIMAEVARLEVEGRPIRLVLDGADEWLMEDSRFLNALEELLQEHRQRSVAPELRLVISCRAAEWPEGKLAHLWPHGHFAVAKLCQLDEESARAFVKAHIGEKAESFWEEVHKLKIHFLAIWPHSLAGLVEEFRENNGSLPATLFDLVKRTALRRSDVHHSETDPERRKRLRSHDAAVDWTYRLASRAAALGCFSGCPRIGLSFGPKIPGVVPLEMLIDGKEPLPDGSTRSITQADLEELPRTALFDRHGDSLVFSHQLMREFLAASWLAGRALPVAQLSSLLGSYRTNGGWRHFPQLSAVAAWLASNPASKDWRRFLIDHDPAVLLRADAAGLSDPEKLEIAKALLKTALKDRALDTSWQHRHLKGLACQGLADVVRPYFLNSSKEAEAARQLAIDIIREAQVTDCAEALWQVIKDPESKMRSDVADALFEVAKTGWDLEWKAVLHGDIRTDNRYTLIGAAVKTLFPERAPLGEVLPHFIPGKDILNSDQLYIDAHADVIEQIKPEDAIEVLRFSAQHHASGFSTSWRSNKDSILAKSLRFLADRLESAEATSAFVEWWWSSILYQHHALEWEEMSDEEGVRVTLSELGFNRPELRYAVLECAVKHPKLSYIKGNDTFWSYFDVFIRLPEDVPWLVSRFECCQPRGEMIYAQWLNDAFHHCRSHPEICEQLTTLYEKSAALRQKLPEPKQGRSILEELDFLQAKRREKDAKRSADFAAKKAGWDKERKGNVVEWFRQAQEKLSQENWRAWQSVENALFCQKYPGDGPVDLDLVDELKSQDEPWILETARLWLKHKPPLFPVADKDTALDLQVSSLRALYALWDRLDDDAEVDQGIRSGWLPHIFACQLRFSWQNGDCTHKNCIRRFVPESAEALLAVVRADYTGSGDSWAVSELDLVATQAIQPLKQLLLDVTPKPFGFLTAMQWLAKHDVAAAEEVARHWLSHLNGEMFGEAEVVLMSAILLHLEGRLWPEIKDRLSNQREVAAKVLHHAFYRIGFDFDKQVDLSKWPSAYLADVAELMIRTFPPKVDRYQEDETDDATRHARDGLIRTMGDRGMTDAIARLEALQIKGTERWFRQVHLRASKERQATLWQPLAPSKLLEMAAKHDFRLVHTENDLMNVVLAALETYQQDLMRSNKLDGRYLRHENDNTPKQENALSDQLVEWLNQRLKIHGLREVSNYDGKRKDILIQVQPPDRELLSLVVEVKKDHSEKLLEKMETQLKHLYLERESRTHGIYLVFWFEDGAHSAHPRVRTLEELAESLSRQAVSLSKDRFHIKSHILDCRVATIQPANPHGKQAGKRRSRKKAPAP
jgi:hypothetical protein